ncbi:MAG: Holliday junction branch migration protein RuvA [Ignavibacteriae bacterium]|nr:MAG: Holliday junction branch migration protein RuvA [Ignavibacteriota bacterium]
MIEYIKGKLVNKKPTSIVIESGGIGYTINITLTTYDILPDAGAEAMVSTHLYIKENPFGVVLYGFSDENEREIFRHIISVSGIGPKTAISMLSAINYRQITEMISSGNYLPLTAISGVGKKTAERLALELKDKLARTEFEPSGVQVKGSTFSELTRISGIISALVNLGYNRLEADKMIRKISSSVNMKEMTDEEIIKEVLRGNN